MVKLGIDTSKLNPKFFEQLQAQKETQLRQAMRPRALFVWKQARSIAPVRTGALKRSIEMQPIADGYFVGTRCPWGGYMESGTTRIAPRAYLRRAIAAMLIQFRKVVLGRG